MKKIVQFLALFSFIMINSYAYCSGKVNVTVKFPNETFKLVEAKHKYSWRHKTLLEGAHEKTFEWDANARTKYHYLVEGLADDNQKVYAVLSVHSFEGHRDWLWDFKSDGSWSLSYLNQLGTYTLKK